MRGDGGRDQAMLERKVKMINGMKFFIRIDVLGIVQDHRPAKVQQQNCHPERSAAKIFIRPPLMGAESRDPEPVSLLVKSQGVLTMGSPANSICLPQFSAKSSQRGFIFSMSAIFFSRRHRLSCFSRAMAFLTSSKTS